ncbi:MAG: hypothetical protein AAGE01_11180 [Pseudomonadota bacterium]
MRRYGPQLRPFGWLLALLLAGCAGFESLDRDAAFIAGDMNGRANGPWFALRGSRGEMVEAARQAGCLAYLPMPGDVAAGGRPASGYHFFSDAMGNYRVAVLQRGEKKTECGSLWTYEYCMFSAERELSSDFWAIRGPRICLPEAGGTQALRANP